MPKPASITSKWLCLPSTIKRNFRQYFSAFASSTTRLPLKTAPSPERLFLEDRPHPLDSKYYILKDILGDEWTKKTVAAWYADEIKLGSFDAIKDDVLTIYYGPDADTAQIAQTFQDYIQSPDAH